MPDDTKAKVLTAIENHTKEIESLKTRVTELEGKVKGYEDSQKDEDWD